MSRDLTAAIAEICKEFDGDHARMMDIVRAVQSEFGCVSGKAMEQIAKATGTHRVEVESVVSFYAFLSEQKKGKVVVRLCDDIIDRHAGMAAVAEAFAQEFGIAFGETSADGRVSLEYTPCIGMPDQAPAALVNDVVVTELDADKARRIAKAVKEGASPESLVHKLGDGNNGNDLVKAMVVNNIRERGEVIFAADVQSEEGLKKALAMSPAEVIRDIKTARLRGRGGAGFPTGMKWDFTRQADGAKKYVLCNADEGEPGTFKDRVVLTECPDMLFEGMTIAGYAIGSDEGVLYLRAEYAYLRPFLENRLAARRNQGLLGKGVCGKDGFDFDIRIQMGAGAYICGEETSLISSCEGLRGDPKNRPPFPAQKGYLGAPTTVNNVETFCCVARILDKGAGWFAQLGSKGSAGTKLLSVSGDCTRPGVYELPFGTTVAELLQKVGAEDAAAVQVGGPSGQLIGPADCGKTICYDDLATGGSVMVFNSSRNVLEIAAYFMDFFIEESCGYCTPCRVGNVLVHKKLQEIMDGNGQEGDLEYLEQLGATMKAASRCGLGQTSANPVVSSIKSFRSTYEALLQKDTGGFVPTFNIGDATSDAAAIAGHGPAHA